MLEQLTGHEDPHPIYERLRAHGPLTRDEDGMWVTTGHALTNKILRDRRFGVRYADGSFPDDGSPLPQSFLGMDAPDHTRLRRLATPAFSPKRIDHYRTRVEKVADSLLDSDEFDLIADFAAPLPISVISDLLGVPDADTADFAAYGALVGASFDTGVTPEMADATDKVLALFDRLISERRRTPGDDVISSLVAAEAEQKLTAREMLGTLVLLLVAGFEAMVNTIGNGCRALLEHPEQWQLLKSNPDLAPAVVEETLRWAPAVHLTTRIAHEQVDEIGKGEIVTLIIAAANRDPEVYPDAHRFDITRPHKPEHLAFSSGAHYCLGATLARMEGDVAFRALARRMPRLRQAGEIRYRESVVIRGMRSMPVSRS
ncbi:cytochrome P450 [Lentzea sp. NPDC058436]|uniref:cytochrome P450 n=1 Tax=Lentzea sp. NPDC058436 TaxID=3346499 RepID=UPI003649AF6E